MTAKERFTDAQYLEKWKARCVVTPSGCWGGRSCFDSMKQHSHAAIQMVLLVRRRVQMLGWGHEYTPANTYWSRRGVSKCRNCRTCQRIRQRVESGWSPEEASGLPPVPPGAVTSRRTFNKRTAAKTEAVRFDRDDWDDL